MISKNFSQIWQCALDAKYGQRKHYRHVLSMTSNIVLYWILWTVCRHLKSSGIILAFSTQHEAYLSCIIAAFLRPTNSLYVCWNSKKIINIALSLQYECMYLRSKKKAWQGDFSDFEKKLRVRLELVSKKLNHLAAILRDYAGYLNFMK